MWRDGVIGGRQNLMLMSHMMAIVWNIGSSFSRNPQSKKPQEFFPHMEEYFTPPSNMTRQERDFLAFTSLPGFRKEFLDILGGNNGR
jgi:hypothetical protein